MRKCWEKKSTDRPTFAQLVPPLEAAVNKLCPDKSLIPQTQTAGDKPPQANPAALKQPQTSTQEPKAPPSLPKPAWQESGAPQAKPAAAAHSLKGPQVEPSSNIQGDGQHGAAVCY